LVITTGSIVVVGVIGIARLLDGKLPGARETKPLTLGASRGRVSG